MSKLKTTFDLGTELAGGMRFDADTVGELRELVSKLAEFKDRAGALEQNDLCGSVAFLESFESPAAERKFILHYVTQAIDQEKPETLLRWALVYMLRTSKIAPEQLHHELLKVLPSKAH